ncbi:hypothetical protein KXV78_009451 [Aspergillus fumigatus]|nr:hypothetical protein KXV78_009451 [Aspergillus fumigatus]
MAVDAPQAKRLNIREYRLARQSLISLEESSPRGSLQHPQYNLQTTNCHKRAMSPITIATLPRMTRDALSELLLSTSSPNKLAIIDTISAGIFIPPPGFQAHQTLKDKEKVVFHCALSQQRGPAAALRYAREREAALGPEESKKQQVYVLEGGFVHWQEKYGKDTRLTEAYVEDIWREY